MMIVVKPCAGGFFYGLVERDRCDIGGQHGDDAVALDPVHDPDARKNEACDKDRAGDFGWAPSTFRDYTVSSDLEVDRSVHQQHGKADHPDKQAERVEQLPEAAAVGHPHVVVKTERNPLQQVAEGDAENECWYESAGEQPPVTDRSPARICHFAAVNEAHRPEE